MSDEQLAETIRKVGVVIAQDFHHTLSSVDPTGEGKHIPGPQTLELARRYVTLAQRPLRYQLTAVEAERDAQKGATAFWLRSATEQRDRALAAEATAKRYRVALVKVQANFNVAHKRAIERGDGVGTQWLNVEFLVRDALTTPEGGE